MKVLHVIPSVSPLHGGPSFAVRRMAEAVAALDVEVDVATTTANGKEELRVPLGRPVNEQGVRYFYFPRQYPKSWTFSWPLTRWLAQYAGAYDVLHVHALFSYPSLAACWAARREGVPYVLRPLGTLDPWALRFRRWKKTPYFWLFERRNLLGAAAVQAVSPQEQRAIKGRGLPIRVVTIPLGVDPPAFEDSKGATPSSRATDSVVKVLFLSRLHPKKGIELLLRAAGLLARQHQILLFIAGDGDAAYVRKLRQYAAVSGLEDRVIFTGFVMGAEKRRLLEQADLFVLPSYDENFGMAVAEALSVGLPVVVSEHVALAEHIREAGAGLVVTSDAPDLARAMATLIKDPELRHRLGQAGRQLVRSEFSWSEVARRLAALYEQLIVSAGPGNSVKRCVGPSAMR
jgi:glycosyltransferase involved in cell wall biosynthesis